MTKIRARRTSAALAFVLIPLAACFSGFAFAAGVSYLELTPTSKAELSAAGPVVLWQTDSWSLLVAGSVSGEQLLLTGSEADYYYLITDPSDTLASDLELLGSTVEFAERTYVVKTSGDAAQELALLRVSFVRLLYPQWFRPYRATAAMPAVAWNQGVQTLVDQVDGEQLFADLVQLVSFGTRQSYTPGCAEAGQWLLDAFGGLGYAVSEQYHVSGMAPNIIAELPGTTTPEEIVIICGHYDSISRQPYVCAPGADDNASGTAATLHAARTLVGWQFEKTIRFIAFSGEEHGLLGSQAYANRAAADGDAIVGVYNFDMIGWAYPVPEDLDCVGNYDSSSLVDHFRQCAATYTDLPTQQVINPQLTYSDHSPFWARGYQAMLGIEDVPINYPYYHSVDDTADKISRIFFTQCAQAAVAGIAEAAVLAGAARPTPTPVPGAIDVHLILNDRELEAGELFEVGVSYRNVTSQDRDLPLVIMLDVQGQYWFWPSWTQQLDYQLRYLPALSNEHYEQILRLTWPAGVGGMIDVRFWAAFLSEDLTGLAGAADMASWSYH